jgi:LmbE family N-acetylglucosaminyl deacetylase
MSGGGVLVLSPHPDDAALSVGGCLPGLAGAVTILTVFGRSNWTRDGGFERGWRRVTEVRRAEEAAHARAIGARLLYPEMLDASVRCRGAFERIFTRAGSVTAPRRLGGVLRDALRRCRPDLVLAPAGIGGHVDHLALRDAARVAAAAGGRRRLAVAFYEDVPYAARRSETALRRWFLALDPRLEPVWMPLAEEQLAAKLARLRIYASQLGPPELRQAERHARRWRQSGPGERLWAAAPLPPLLAARRRRPPRAGRDGERRAPGPCG